jgi:hypothetical protein
MQNSQAGAMALVHNNCRTNIEPAYFQRPSHKQIHKSAMTFSCLSSLSVEPAHFSATDRKTNIASQHSQQLAAQADRDVCCYTAQGNNRPTHVPQAQVCYCNRSPKHYMAGYRFAQSCKLPVCFDRIALKSCSLALKNS